jgi:hypothetical protein
MSGRGGLPELPPSALRDVATPERVDRVWKRLEHDLAGSSPRTRGSFEWVWAPAAVCIIFLSGFFAGLGWRKSDPPAQASLSPEPLGAADNAATNAERRGSPGEQPRSDEPPKKTLRPRLRPVLPEIELGSTAPLSVPPASVDPGPPDWQRVWLEEQDADRAAQAIARQGGFDPVIAQASPEQLMILVNIAQAVGEPAQVVAALRRVVERYPRDPAAPQAAFMLGTVLEKAGDRAGAARAFEACRALSPQSEIAEDALARQIDAALEQGDLAEAHRLFGQYERDFPRSSRLAEFRAALSKGAGASSSSMATEVDPRQADGGGAAAARTP